MKIASIFGPIVGGAFMINVPFITSSFVMAMGLEDTALKPLISVSSIAAFSVGCMSIVVGLKALKDGVLADIRDSAPDSCDQPTPTTPKPTLEAAPMVLAERSGDQDLQAAVEAFEASRSAWDAMTKDDLGNGARSRLLHGIRTVREACLRTLDNPDLTNSREAIKSISETMKRLTAEMDRHRTSRTQADLLSLEQDLTIMERQLFLQPISATKELA